MPFGSTKNVKTSAVILLILGSICLGGMILNVILSRLGYTPLW